MEEKIKITAILKTKNSEEKLCESLESIKDFDEIIIIDEHSTDDTVEIAKEYKAKIIYADKNDFSIAQNQALQEAKNEWVFIIEENEIIPQKLIFEIQKYILNPKKNKNCVSFYQKSFYLNKEIKSALEKNVLRLFKKECAEFLNDYSLNIKTNGKIHKIKPSKNAKNAYILKYIEADILKTTANILEKNRNVFKKIDKIASSIFYKPLFTFIYWYFMKGAIMDGRRGFVFAQKKYIEQLILQIMILEKGNKNDLW